MFRSLQSIYFLVIILAIGSLGPLLYLHQSWLIQSRNYAEITSHLSMIREEAAEAHLWAEELITGDTTEDVAEVAEHFGVASEEAARFESELATKIPNLMESVVEGHTISDHARTLKQDLVDLELKANSRLADRAISGAGSESDISFDAIYHRALNRTRILEQTIRNQQTREVGENLRDHWYMLLMWASTLCGTLLFLFFLRKRQHIAEEEKKKLEGRFQEAQKLESLGVLAGGIAHDFNNLLQSVSGNTSLLLHDEALPAEIKDQVLEIEAGARKASDLTSQMLAYSGKGRLTETVVLFDKMVEEIASLVRLSTPKMVDVKYHLDASSACIRCNLTQIQQVVMNLVINATEASAEDPKPVWVRTEVRSYTASELLDCGVGLDEPEAGDYIVFKVEDQGSGMTQDTLDHCFEPFFSTKFTGRGLGLAAVLGIVRGHEGVLKVDSNLGVGTTFQVLFPLSKEEPEINTSQDLADVIEGGGRRVLVVDDDDMVRSILIKMLVRCGYSVDSAVDGLQGIQCLESCCEECQAEYCSAESCREAIVSGHLYHAVVLDMEMPGRTGLEIGREIRSRWQGLPLILSSGYGREAIQGDTPFDAFLQKPYSLKKLAKTIGETAVAGSNGDLQEK
ncbi:MAG: ATP-binding protein [Planctomycetota bacterium]|nr:ATP-binding protein [Planctomycetota bacterium]